MRRTMKINLTATVHRIAIRLRHALRRSPPLQIGTVLGLWALGNVVARASGLPLPGGVVGMAILLMLLATHCISPISIGRGARWLIGEMLLFFLPAVMALLDHRDLLGAVGLKLVVVIFASTAMVMMGTALTVELFQRWRMRRVAG